ncbi:hypothetical protein JW935_11915 [candidate division KSB1 bacterium]|nr:hypothetical protein [candidate division KSB1 bacterium]
MSKTKQNSIILNKHLFTRTDHRFDKLFITTLPPQQQENRISINVRSTDKAAVLDSAADKYPHQPTIGELRTGKGEFWLLSGGTLIFNQEECIAAGLRDGNAADPFLWTNIGAGRCDRKLLDHCREEMASEFILCAKNSNNRWQQVDFGPHTVPINSLRVAAVDKKMAAIQKMMDPSLHFLPTPTYLETPPEGIQEKHVHVCWHDSVRIIHEELLQGFCLIDRKNKTTEFRLTVQLDLSPFTETVLFFGEGTGYAEWLSLEALNRLVKAEKVAQRAFLSPVLRALVMEY